ncbi:DNA helicase KNAG_0D02580 [Huiozyma naganishii CBS 8797]|uniref:ATP-dependent DNA helicase CHL1 n=1 Tax=Huiozyma naganishii (strain ATCC MYA-139 / BCRC 22969 / CBS 8797 / KCTC 17520 / NBRC 10181 / NCYC 3082 / Yp74L-3) TaxID=1071383 RepID=J7RY23_HUIN7|nr:hypothetical protein KNAG_0D02580 [Kazachstania naganishii CBS 8797]CCK70007.1 hypothetical protein KNAG_0D02580 [Kazachstania naganishii CBS 8797]
MAGMFHHPFEPYDIQVELMQCIYDVLSSTASTNANVQRKKIGILESPTGTGKTLSLICASLSWLRDNKLKLLSCGDNVGGENSDSDSEDEPEWVKETFQKKQLQDKLGLLDEFERHLDIIGKQGDTPSAKHLERPTKTRKLKHVAVKIEEEDYLPKPYEEDGPESSQDDKNLQLNKEVAHLLAKIDASHGNKNPQDNNPFATASVNPVKIFFASRTHSQLNQFASQLQLPKFPSSFPDSVPNERVKFLPLASKKQLCINPEVTKWGTLEAINDACYEVRHSPKGCPYYQNTTEWHYSKDTTFFKDKLFESVHDIENLVETGQHLRVCPYYASRDTLPGMEVITLPYQYLLSESTRDIMGIDLKDSIVIIDEAHNLVDTVNSIHSAKVTLDDLITCENGIRHYLQKFKLRLNPGNRVNLLKLLKLISTISQYIKSNFKKPGQKVDANDILGDSNADILNIHRLIKYIRVSKVAYKIDTYIKALDKKTADDSPTDKPGPTTSSQPLLFKVVSFLTCLTNPASEGQFFFETGPSMEYMLLEPSKQFESIIEDARCVFLAGGTMEPISDLTENLFPLVPKEEISIFQCNHIVPDANVETFVINEPGLEFTFANRGNNTLINIQLFSFYKKLSKTVPLSGGIVGFFPSYQFLQNIIDQWKENGIFDEMNRTRKIFYESKNGKDPLNDYTTVVTNQDPKVGAILFAVVGGRLSEGINFQDNLCRAVVMTGLPFPNLASGELQIKKLHLQEKVKKRGGDTKQATKDFIENICMKAVNQSVGRAIRHMNDYANIYLLDNRYSNESIRGKLSLWVRRRIQPQTSLDGVITETTRFFTEKEK